MKITAKYVFFHGGIFSNWHAAEFIDPITKVKFYNTEQCYMWYKADFFKDLTLREQIEAEKDPAKAKKLGRQVKNYHDEHWAIVRFGFMAYANMLKYYQNEDLAVELLNTEDKMLVEASATDTIWGIGLGINDPDILDVTKWKGHNLLGLVLAAVKVSLIAKLEDPDDE